MKWILVVDDEPHVTRLVRTRLENCGWGVKVAPNGEAALEKIANFEFEVLITDLTMPRMGGKELCDEVRKNSSGEIPYIIVVSSRAQNEFREWAETVRGLEFMEKPVSLIKLVQRLESVLGPAPGREAS